MKLAVCLVFRGELLRNTQSYHHNNKNKELKEYDLSEESFIRQNNIMESIINHIIEPYQKNGFKVFVSGCIYECPEYIHNLMRYFPRNTIKQIELGKTNQAELFYKSIEQANKEHPNCIEYISLRMDYIMLKNIIIKELDSYLYVGFAWKNINNYPDVDVFFIISNNAINIFKAILYLLGLEKDNIDTHSITDSLKNKNILCYPIWNDYNNERTGISYNEYIKNITFHINRPFVNYMRNIKN